MLDTYAYATLVLEASKPNPDYDLIKKDVVDVLRGVVEHREEEIVKKFKGLSQADRYLQVDRYQLAQLKDITGAPRVSPGAGWRVTLTPKCASGDALRAG
jgi:hypothetical protein